MTQERRLFDAIGELPDRQIDEAGTHRFHRRVWTRWAALAAVAALVVGLGTLAMRLLGGASSEAPGANAGGGGGEGETYMAYCGPVFPLLSLNGAGGVTASRNVDYDFSPYATRIERYGDGEDEWYETYDNEAIVTDSYVLTNETDEAVTLELAYPFAGSFSDPETYLPVITVGGESVGAGLLAGPYAGGYCGAASPDADDTERWNLAQPTSWLDYKARIESGYLETVLDEFPVLDQPLIVYRVSDYVVPETDAVNPTLNLEFYVDEGAQIITFNSNGGTNDEQTGYRERHIGGLGNQYRKPQPMYVAILGGDLRSLTMQGYENGGCEPGEELEITATLTREETTLGEFIQVLIADTDGYGWYSQPEQTEIYDYLPDGVFYGCVAEMIEQYGFLSDDPAERYWGAMEDFLGETRSVMRLMYRTFELTIPAHDSVTVTASMRKHASYDFIGENAGRSGYDLVTTLGSNLTFTEQTASVSRTECIELVRDSFGFDLGAGVTRVQLDMEQAHYCLEITKKEEP